MQLFAPGSSPANVFEATDIRVALSSKEGLPPTVKEAAETSIFCGRPGVVVESTTLDGEAAWRCPYTLGDPRDDLRGIALFVRRGDVQYIVNFSGKGNGLNAAKADYEEVLKSWKWRK